MKRAYRKPSLAVESFQLDAAIAGSCSHMMALNQSLDECSYNDDQGINYGWEFFGPGCDFNQYELDSCYQAMAMGNGYLES